jgi:hypothetical protein
MRDQRDETRKGYPRVLHRRAYHRDGVIRIAPYRLEILRILADRNCFFQYSEFDNANGVDGL